MGIASYIYPQMNMIKKIRPYWRKKGKRRVRVKGHIRNYKSFAEKTKSGQAFRYVQQKKKKKPIEEFLKDKFELMAE